jgi:hypothetical protein
MMPTAPNNAAALRRLKLEELLAKVEQIEEQARLTLDEHPQGHTIERQRLILAIARQVRAHLADQLAGGEREPVARITEGRDRVYS